MKKKITVLTLGAVLFAVCFSVEAQPQSKVVKIGWLSSTFSSRPTAGFDAFRQVLRERGYIEGKNIVFEFRYAEEKYERLPALADELLRIKVDLIVTPNTVTALAAKNATKSIPIVFQGVQDPVAAGLIDSLARPGGNVTGLASFGTELAGKRLELLKETLPKASRVGVLWNPSDPASTMSWKESLLTAKHLGLRLHSMEVSSADKFEAAFTEAKRAGSAAVSVSANPLATTNRKQVVDLAAKNRLPAIYPREDYVDIGGLMSYGADRADPYRRVAVFVEKILSGIKPADIPVEQPTKFEFVINLKAAKQIGLTIPPNVLARADRVIR
jgi:putative ABC transport system substrate-binding protein